MTLIDDVARVGEWRDVIYTFSSGTRIRFQPVDFTGMMIVHCHILQHEDMGMMGMFYIDKPCNGTAYPPEALLTAGAITGIVIGSVAAVTTIALLVWYLRHKESFFRLFKCPCCKPVVMKK